ncbi:response regulator transcription factor [Duganella levis]|uniref:Response regulator n=1 Tax=Duganella levis TaxID=2692169 RepID=A0ABW9W4A7_9BURK|nr:response regulator transcription factor [Duganella levis]MYN28720.1 response regulator [Duganella levis]
MRLLLVEDDPALGKSIRSGLDGFGFVVDWVQDGLSAETALFAADYLAVLLDIGLPRKSGLAVLGSMRATGNNTPVIVLSARDAVRNRIEGLDAGADDYLDKPFDLNELAARIRALLRRNKQQVSPVLRHAGITFDPSTQQVHYQGRHVVLGARELALLAALMSNPGVPLSRSQLIERIYGWNDEVESNTIEVHIHKLRKKLSPDFVHNIRGIGYLLADE